MMDINLQSAALIVPHFRAQISAGISAIKENFFVEDFEKNETSPLFLLPDDPEIIDFHHQEIVESSSQLSFCASSPNQHVKIGDLDSLDTNDLFSFVLDTADSKSAGSISFNSKSASEFRDCGPDRRPSSSTFEFAPSDFLDLLDSTSCADLTQEFNQDFDNCESSFDPASLHSSSVGHLNSLPNSQSLCTPLQSFKVDLCTEESGVFSDEYDKDDYFEYENFAKSSKFISDYLHNEDLGKGKPGQPLHLSNEEKRILTQMGERIPKTFPLMRDEERAIRLMRRKIRNKLSAKASRTRRQEYLCTLESRISFCHKENQRLRRRVEELEKDKLGLLNGLRQMRSYVARLISGVPTITRSSLDDKYPLLPVTIAPTSSQTSSHFSKSRSAAGGTSLLIIAFMILAWATLMPLPSFEFNTVSGSGTVFGPRANPISGQSRTLLTVDVPESSDLQHIDNKIKLDNLDVKIKKEFPLAETSSITRDLPFSEEMPGRSLKVEPVLQIPLSLTDL